MTVHIRGHQRVGPAASVAEVVVDDAWAVGAEHYDPGVDPIAVVKRSCLLN